jgi:hypothetical protein
MEFVTIPAVGVDDGAGCVNAVAEVDGQVREVTFYALIMGRRFNILPGQKRPFVIMNFQYPIQMTGTGQPIFDGAETLTVGDAVLYRNDSDVTPDTGESRYTSMEARTRILTALARVLDPENFTEIAMVGPRVKAFRILQLGLGANIRTFRRNYEQIRRHMVGRFVFALNGTIYHIDITDAVVLSQPGAADLYLRQTVDFDFDQLSYAIGDIGTWTLDWLSFFNGILDEDSAAVVDIAIHYLRERLRERLEAQFPTLEFHTRDLEALINTARPEVLVDGIRHNVSSIIADARLTTWRESLRQLAPKIKGKQYDKAFFVGGGANVFRPTIEAGYKPGLFYVSSNAHMVVAWGLYLAARSESLRHITPIAEVKSGKKQRPALVG